MSGNQDAHPLQSVIPDLIRDPVQLKTDNLAKIIKCARSRRRERRPGSSAAEIRDPRQLRTDNLVKIIKCARSRRQRRRPGSSEADIRDPDQPKTSNLVKITQMRP